VTHHFRLHGYAAARRVRRRPPPPAPVDVVTVNRAVMTAALALAGGDARRLQVRSATEVLVTNRPRQGR
jgi:hypothetical protein